MRHVWQPKKAPQGDWNGYDAVHDKEPLPSSQARVSVHAAVEPGLKVATEHTGN